VPGVQLEVEEIDEREPSGAAAVPVEDAAEPPARDEQVPTPEIAVAETSRQAGEAALEPAAELPEPVGGLGGAVLSRRRGRGGGRCRRAAAALEEVQG